MRNKHLSKEIHLLLMCVQRHLTSSQRDAVENLVQAGLDLDSIYSMSRQHGLSMLLYRGLLQLRFPALESLVKRLEQDVSANAVEYEILFPQQLAGILNTFNHKGIKHIVLKGAVLGQETYQQATLRPYNDLDILVHEADLETSETELQRLGYVPDETLHTRDWYRENHHHLVPYVQAGMLAVEIHRELVESDREVGSHIHLDTLWEHAQPIRIAGADTARLCPEHQLIHLCVHTANVHLFEMGLMPLCDVLETITQYGDSMRWSMVQQDSSVWGCERQVLLVLRLVEQIFDREFSPANAVFREEVPEDLLSYSLTNALLASIHGMKESSGLAEAWQQTSMEGRIRAGFTRMFPPSAEVANRFGLDENDPRRWILYPHWQVNMIRRHLGSMRKLIQADAETLASARLESSRRALLNWLNEK